MRLGTNMIKKHKMCVIVDLICVIQIQKLQKTIVQINIINGFKAQIIVSKIARKLILKTILCTFVHMFPNFAIFQHCIFLNRGDVARWVKQNENSHF